MIRKAKLSEIEEIMAITRACGRKMASEGIFQWNDHYPSRAAFINDVNLGDLFILLINDTIVGSIVISTTKDKFYNEVDWLTADSDHYYIHRLAIHPDFQKRGFAKKLMDFAEKLAAEKNICSIRLDTFSKNDRNQRFYETRGYTRLGNIYFPKQSEHPFYCYELVINK